MPNLPFIAAALFALVVGPLLYRAAAGRNWALSALDGFVLTSVTGLVLVFVLPEAIASAGWWVIIPAFAGLCFPLLMEQVGGFTDKLAHGLVLWVALGGLVIHTVLDGFVLVDVDHANAGAIGLAVIVHRLPVGLAVWNLVAPRFGESRAWATLGVIAAGTLVGVAAGDAMASWAQGSVWLAGFQAFVAGSLLHVVTHEPGHVHAHAHGDHSHDHEHDHHHVHGHHGHHGHDDQGVGPRRVAEGLGAFAGLALVIFSPLLFSGHGHDHGMGVGYGHRLLDLALESAPALLLGFALAGIVGAMLPSTTLGFLKRGPKPWQAAKGMATGIPIPICSCGVVPLYESLTKRGVPATAGMAFFIATPEIGIESLLLTIPLIGAEFAMARLVVAAVVALIVGTVIGGLVKSSGRSADSEVVFEEGGGLKEAWQFTRDVIDDTAAWIVAGLLIAAAFDTGALGVLSTWPDWLEVAAFAVLGIPVYVCASGATPVAAALIVAGVSPGAALAFLVAGPATNVTTFGVLSKLHGRWIAVAFGAAVATLALISGISLNAVWDAASISTDALTDHEHASALWGAVQWASLSVLGFVFADSVLRRGPRGFMAEVFELGNSHAHEHAEESCESDSCGSCSH